MALRRTTILVVTLFWIGQFGATTIFAQINALDYAWESVLPRALICVAGEAISLAAIAIQHRWHTSRFYRRAYVAVAFTVVSAAILGALHIVTFDVFVPVRGNSGFWVGYWSQALPRLWVFASVYAMSLAISYSADVRARDEEIADLRTLAQDAQLRALRSQINPHFLFNALNSIAALIRDRQPDQAEEITEQLADFLRITLALDPQELIPLREEIALQTIYLDIQKVRFPTRLNARIDIAAGANHAFVPSLILQPLIENSAKYAVARSAKPVTVEISAAIEGDRLRIRVADDGGNAAVSPEVGGTGMGLQNVRDRLSAHYGRTASFTAKPRAGGGFENLIVIPLDDRA